VHLLQDQKKYFYSDRKNQEENSGAILFLVFDFVLRQAKTTISLQLSTQNLEIFIKKQS